YLRPDAPDHRTVDHVLDINIGADRVGHDWNCAVRQGGHDRLGMQAGTWQQQEVAPRDQRFLFLGRQVVLDPDDVTALQALELFDIDPKGGKLVILWTTGAEAERDIAAFTQQDECQLQGGNAATKREIAGIPLSRAQEDEISPRCGLMNVLSDIGGIQPDRHADELVVYDAALKELRDLRQRLRYVGDEAKTVLPFKQVAIELTDRFRLCA